MRLVARAYATPKLGACWSDLEDACAYDEPRGRLAVADGASSSYQAGPWAQRLAAGYVEEPATATTFGAWVEVQRRAFPRATVDPTKWWAEEVALRGSYATLLGVQLTLEDGPARWDAVAVGDSCLFHVRAGRLLCSFPVEHPGDFTMTPPLVGSRDGEAPGPMVASGAIEVGDQILVMSDALAHWSLSVARTREEVWAFLGGLRSDTFGPFADDARLRGGLDDDDVTLLRCVVRP